MKRSHAIVSLVLLASIGYTQAAIAQVSADGTVGTIVNTAGNIFTINGGTRSGNNLFHSFSQFSILTNRSAIFNNATDVQNIFSRVTGGAVSNINGLIQTNGTANLFLMNPSGIIFGTNARLNIGGSFVSTTASSLKFANGSEFASIATPLPTPLLTISAPIGLQMGTNPGTITNSSRANNGSNVPLGLRVRDGRSISLIGGNVEITGGRINALGGKVELIALGSGGVADFSLGDKTTTTTVKENAPLANITVNSVGTNIAEVSVMSGGGGDISIAGQNVSILNRSNVRAGISSTMGTTASVAGNIDIFAPGRLQVRDSSNIYGRIESNARGQGGNINIRAGVVSLTEGGRVEASLLNGAQGNAGKINILADAIEISGTVPSGSFTRKSGMSSSTQLNSTGNGGLINLQADRISLTEGADIEVSTSGTGNAGSVDIKSKNLFVSGISQYTGFGSTIVGTVWNNGIGEGGNIKIETDSFHLSEGARIVSVTNGKGNAGNITIDARSSLIEGVGRGLAGPSPSQVLTGVNQGTGNGGTLTFNTDSLTLLNGGQVNANTQGNGNAGSIEITANNILIDGIHPLSATVNTNLTSRIGNDVGLTANGNGGIVKIVANSMQLSNGGEISSYSITNLPDTGNAGTVNLNIRDRITLDRGGLSTRTTNEGMGGKIDITTGQLSLNNQSFIQSYTSGSGNAGIITVKAGEVGIDGNSQVSTGSIGSGSAGNISFVETNNFRLTGGSQVTSSSSQTGDAGSIDLNIAHQLFADNGVFSTSNRDGVGGRIDITTGELGLSNQSSIDSSTTGRGNAGQVTINAANSVNVDRSQISSQSAGSGNSGTIKLTTGRLGLSNNALLSTASSDSGQAGNVVIQSNDGVTLQNGSQITSRTTGSGLGGTVDLTARSLFLNTNSQINASTVSSDGGNLILNVIDLLRLDDRSLLNAEAGGTGNGGNVKINAGFVVGFGNSDIIANAIRGNGGTVEIATQGIFGLAYRPQLTANNDITASSQLGLNGTVQLNTLNINPASALNTLPSDVAQSTQLDDRCAAAKTGSFISTGRGGIPHKPSQRVKTDRTWHDLRDTGSDRTTTTVKNPVITTITQTPIVEASALRTNPDGSIDLVAPMPSAIDSGVTCAVQ